MQGRSQETRRPLARLGGELAQPPRLSLARLTGNGPQGLARLLLIGHTKANILFEIIDLQANIDGLGILGNGRIEHVRRNRSIIYV